MATMNEREVIVWHQWLEICRQHGFEPRFIVADELNSEKAVVVVAPGAPGRLSHGWAKDALAAFVWCSRHLQGGGFTELELERGLLTLKRVDL